jgi:hypothetical protein
MRAKSNHPLLVAPACCLLLAVCCPPPFHSAKSLQIPHHPPSQIRETIVQTDGVWESTFPTGLGRLGEGPEARPPGTRQPGPLAGPRLPVYGEVWGRNVHRKRIGVASAPLLVLIVARGVPRSLSRSSALVHVSFISIGYTVVAKGMIVGSGSRESSPSNPPNAAGAWTASRETGNR